MILGIDPGNKRIGIAAADDETRFARPLEVIDIATQDSVARIAQIASQLGVSLIVVGKPIGLSGKEGPAADEQSRFVARLRAAVGIPVAEHDERFTTSIAEQGLRAGGGDAAARKRIRDAVAAQVMLQGYLDSRA